MPPDLAREEDVRAWLEKATDDLRAAAHVLTANPPITSAVAFHAQQACEKALKALLAWHDKRFRKTHSLEELGEACLAISPSLADAIDGAVPLSEYAWRFRYPGELHELTVGEAEAALATAQRLYRSVLDCLPEATRPKTRP
jgi:HEPN domain-containing protein